MHLLVVPQVGLAGKALVAQRAGERLLFGVDPSVAYELRGHAERLPALQTLVALGLRVNPPVVFEGHQVGELFLADGAEEGARLVAVLVVEEGAGVAVSAAAVLAHVALLLRAGGLVARLGIGDASRNVGQRRRGLIAHLVDPQGRIHSSRVPANVDTLGFSRAWLKGVLIPVPRVLVLLVARCVGKALLARAADHRLVLRVHLHVALQVCHQAEGLAALGAAVTPHHGVYLQSERIGKGLETQGAVVEVFGVCLFMVEERAGVAVGTPTQVTPAAGIRSYSMPQISLFQINQQIT